MCADCTAGNPTAVEADGARLREGTAISEAPAGAAWAAGRPWAEGGCPGAEDCPASAPSLDAVEGPLAVPAAAVGVIRRVVPLLQITNSGASKHSHASCSGSTVCWPGSSVHMQVLPGRMCAESRNMYTKYGNLPSLHAHLLTSCCATLGCAMPFAGASRAARPPAGCPGAGPARSFCRAPCPFSAAASRRSCPALSAKRICCGRALPYRLWMCLSTSACMPTPFLPQAS